VVCICHYERKSRVEHVEGFYRSDWKWYPRVLFLFICLLFCGCCLVLFETGSHYVAQAGLKLMILMPPSTKPWDYRHVPLCLASSLLFKNNFVEVYST
jgi:hypothetical protein